MKPDPESSTPAATAGDIRPSEMVCYACGTPLRDDPTLCPECGRSQETTCFACGADFRKELGNCPRCGREREHGIWISRRKKAPVPGVGRRTFLVPFMMGAFVGAVLMLVVMAMSETVPGNDPSRAVDNNSEQRSEEMFRQIERGILAATLSTGQHVFGFARETGGLLTALLFGVLLGTVVVVLLAVLARSRGPKRHGF